MQCLHEAGEVFGTILSVGSHLDGHPHLPCVTLKAKFHIDIIKPLASLHARSSWRPFLSSFRFLVSSGAGLVLEKGPKIVKLPKGAATASAVSADTTAAALQEVIATKATEGSIDPPSTPATPDII